MTRLLTTMFSCRHVGAGEVVREAVGADHAHDIAGRRGGERLVERPWVLVVDEADERLQIDAAVGDRVGRVGEVVEEVTPWVAW